MAKTSGSNPIHEGLRLMNHCPVCKGEYGANEANILEQKEEANLVHITCPHCHNSVVAVIVVTSFGLSSIGMVTDLHPQDVVRLRKKGKVTEDEVLGLHEHLKKFNNLAI